MNLVNFVIAGTQKGGTTALHSFLRQHPDVFLPKTKELHFFDKPVRWPERMGLYFRYHRHFRDAPRNALKGEATPIYMFWPGAMARLHAYNPTIRVIVILRDPVERAYSHWAMETGRNRETRPFGEVIRAREPSPPDRIRSYVGRGFYAKQLEMMFEVIPRDQVLVLFNEDLRARATEVMRLVEWHLGLDPHTYTELTQEIRPTNTRCSVPLDSRDRAFLRTVYAEDTTALARMLGRDLSRWLK